MEQQALQTANEVEESEIQALAHTILLAILAAVSIFIK